MKKYSFPGSFTVEASFVLSITLFVLCGMIYTGMALHDRAVIRFLSMHFLHTAEEMTEKPCTAEGKLSTVLLERGECSKMLFRAYADTGALEREFSEAVSENMLLTELTGVHITIEEEYVWIRYEGTIRFPPGNGLRQWIGIPDEIKGEQSVRIGTSPPDIIRIMRSVKEIGAE